MHSNNPIIKHVFTADPTVLEYEGIVYLYTGHDEAPIGVNEYRMRNWLCFSSSDLVNWIEHPSPLKATDFKWASGDAYASKVIYHNNKFYWFAAVTHKEIPEKAIGVAVSNHPTGPFTDVKGNALITGDILPDKPTDKTNLDPSVLIDDGKAYIFWGNGTCYYARLSDTLMELEGPIKKLDFPEFNEGSHIYKRNGLYYFMYGYGSPEKVAYAMSNDINGEWKFKGIVSELAGNCETNRPATLDYKGKSYFFYHNGGLKDGGSHRRSVCIDYLHYQQDGSINRVIMTTEGVM
jgi:hypothetical protein